MNDNWICSELLKQVTASPQQSANNLNKLVRSYGVVLRCVVCRRTCWESEVCAADERCRSSVHQHTASRRDHITPVLLQPRCVRLLKDQPDTLLPITTSPYFVILQRRQTQQKYQNNAHGQHSMIKAKEVNGNTKYYTNSMQKLPWNVCLIYIDDSDATRQFCRVGSGGVSSK